MKKTDERKQRMLELATLGRLTIPQAAEKVGIRTGTFYRWLDRDPDYRAQYELWKSGPPADAATVAQARRIITDELALRILNERSKLPLRDLLNIHDRLLRETRTHTEEKDVPDDRDERPRLTPEEVERIWEEIERDAPSPDPQAPGGPTKP
jgi:transposase-like protein